MKPKTKTFTIRVTIRKHWAEAQLVGFRGDFTTGSSPRKAVQELLERLDHTMKVLGYAAPDTMTGDCQRYIKRLRPMFDKIKEYRK